MPDKVCTRYKDSDGLDVGCHLITKEYMIENYPSLVDPVKMPGLWLWGYNGSGVIGNNIPGNINSPAQTISGGANWRSVDAAWVHTAAIKTDGTLWLWGCGGQGRLGNNDATTNRSSPVQTISGGTNWRTVSVGGSHTAAIKTDGTLWLWAYGNSGRLGANTTISHSSPIQTISGGTNWRNVSTGAYHTTSIKTDGTLWSWGRGLEGQLGNNSIPSQSSPVQTVSGGTNWRTVSAGPAITAATKTDGTLWLWGCGARGRLGNESLINRSSPVQTISGGTNWRTASAGFAVTAATKTDGTLWIWGHSVAGNLGTNALIDQSSPVQTISGGTNWRSVSAGRNFSVAAATKTDGTLWAWGNGSVGSNGNGLTNNQSSPVQTISGGTDWRSVSSDAHTAAIKDLGDI